MARYYHVSGYPLAQDGFVDNVVAGLKKTVGGGVQWLTGQAQGAVSGLLGTATAQARQSVQQLASQAQASVGQLSKGIGGNVVAGGMQQILPYAIGGGILLVLLLKK